MKIRPALRIRVVCLLLAPAWAASCLAQGKDGGLTGEFDKLSPKERSKIAARETQEAAADSGYQDIMQQADAAFRAGRYEDALTAFQEARTLRPYNVYPKVKIQDLQALIKKRDEERSAQNTAVPPPTADPPGPAVVAAPPSHSTPEPSIDTPLPPASSDPPVAIPATPVTPTGPKVGTPHPDPATPIPHPADKSPTPVPVSTPGPDILSATIGERIYMEAGATVTERTVDDIGRPVVYKKVVHPWGQTFHFKDGLAISEREWTDRFNE